MDKQVKNRFDQITEKQNDNFTDAMQELKSFSNVLKTVQRLDRDKSNQFRLLGAQKTAIKAIIKDGNQIDDFIQFAGKKVREKWNRETVPYAVLSVNDKQKRKIRLTDDDAKNKELITEKVEAVKAKVQKFMKEVVNVDVELSDIDVDVETKDITRERKFTAKELLKMLQKIQANYDVHREKGFKSNKIESVRVTCGLSKKVDAKTA